MKQLITLSIAMLLTIPILAQSIDETYTFAVTGTQIDYSSTMDFELTDGLLVFTSATQQMIVLDYPFVNALLSESNEPSLEYLVQNISEELLGDSIDSEAIYFFDVDGRKVAAYDFEGFEVPGSVYAIEFTNGGTGMLVTFNISEGTEDAVLKSFDSFDELIDDISLNRATVHDKPAMYRFESDGHFIAPAGWSVEGRLNGDLEYVIIKAPEGDLEITLLDFSQLLSNGTDLKDIIEASQVDWENDYDVRFTGSEAESYFIGDREAIHYKIKIRNILGSFDGELIVMRFQDKSIVAAILYGAIEDYKLEISQILGSFNNIGALLEFMN